jgi:hypothetical protein
MGKMTHNGPGPRVPAATRQSPQGFPLFTEDRTRRLIPKRSSLCLEGGREITASRPPAATPQADWLIPSSLMFAPAMKSFLRNHGPSLAVVVLILFAISLMQGGISSTMTLGALRSFLSSDLSLLTAGLIVLRFGFVTALVVLWLFKLKLKHALFQLIILVNAWFTLALVGHTSLSGGPHASARRRADGGVEHPGLFNLVLDY